MSLIITLYNIRRKVLKTIIPEFIWPKSVTLDNAQIPVRGMDYSFGVKRVLVLDNYEMSERALIKKSVQKGDVVVEMGGSIGVVAGIVSKIVGENGKVVSIEASDKLATQARSWLSKTGNVINLHGFGFPIFNLPAKFKELHFVDDDNSLGGRIDFNTKANTTNTTPSYDLNVLEQQYKIQPNVLILDIEGSEIVFLENEISIPQYVKTIIIEMHPNLYGQDKEDEIMKVLGNMGFKIVEEIKHVFLVNRN